MSFGERLVIMRKIRKVSQKQLAAQLGVNYNVIWYMEDKGMREPALEVRMREALKWGEIEDRALDILMGTEGQAA